MHLTKTLSLTILLSSCGLNDANDLFRPAVTLGSAPPTIRGGALVVDGEQSFVVDRDRRALYRISATGVSQLSFDDTPERVAVLGDQTFVLSGPNGRLSKLNRFLQVEREVRLCREPRSVAASGAVISVVCLTGEVLIYDTNLALVRTLNLDAMLVDVAQRNNTIWVLAQSPGRVIELTDSGDVQYTYDLPRSAVLAIGERQMNIALTGARRLLVDDRRVAVLHQGAARDQALPRGRYERSLNEDCAETSQSAVTLWTLRSQNPRTHFIARGRYVSDFDMRGDAITVAMPGGEERTNGSRSLGTGVLNGDCVSITSRETGSQVIASRFDQNGGMVTYSREPAWLEREGNITSLATTSVRDTGHDIFYLEAGERVACASCHIDGAEDSETWRLGTPTALRTPSLRGGLSHTAPFHWAGDLPTLDSVVGLHFPEQALRDDQQRAFVSWLDRLPSYLPPRAEAPTSEGQVIFANQCASCHGTDGYSPVAQSMPGTNGASQVPSLAGINYRRSLGSTGCADNIEDYLRSSCHQQHAEFNLTGDELASLLTYLETR